MRDLAAEQRVAAVTHTFQNIRNPSHPEANAICSRCGLVLPNGPIIAIGPEALPPCTPVQDNGPVDLVHNMRL